MKSIICSTSLLFLALSTIGCGSKPASVAVNPISGNVYVTHEDSLEACDQTARNCQLQRLTFKPISAAIGPDGGLVFLTSSSIFRCDDAGQNCREAKLPIGDAVGVGVSASGQIVAVSKKGVVAVCDNAGCQKVGK